MNLRDLFKKEKKLKSKPSDIPKDTIDDLELENRSSDLPKVIFEDLELQVTVGQWLGLLVFDTFDSILYMHLSAEELMEKYNISKEQLEEISEKFGYLLKLAGIDKSETCTLNQFDKDEFSFNCHFSNSNSDAKISLKRGNFMDYSEFNIDYQNEKKFYIYQQPYEKTDKPQLHLRQINIRNASNNNTLERFFIYYAGFHLKNNQYNLSINVEIPDSMKKSNLDNDIFRLKNEDELQQYLLGLTFPLDIREVYKKLCDISLNSIKEYPLIELEIRKQVDEINFKTTDKIILKHGTLCNFTITKEGNTYIIDSDENWTYSSPEFVISLKDGLIAYSRNSIPHDEISKITPPAEQFREISDDAKQVKTSFGKLIK